MSYKREEFLDKLRSGLNRLPADELENVLSYYNEIFLDAGEDREEETAENLGSIEDIIRQIYAENGIEPDGRPTYMVEELKQQQDNMQTPPQPPIYRGYTVKDQQPVNTSRLILLIVLFPLWLPLLIVSFVLTIVFFVVGFVIEIALIAGGVSLIVSGIIELFRIPPIGVISIGAGLMLCAVFGLSFRAVFKGSWKLFAAAINKLVNIAHNTFVGGEPVV